jgi:hypothetical protein
MEAKEEAAQRPRSSRSAPVDYSAMAAVVRYNKTPADFNERAERACSRLASCELPTQRAAAAAEGIDDRRLSDWKRENVAQELPGEDGLVAAQRMVDGGVISFRREPRPAHRETWAEGNARHSRNHLPRVIERLARHTREQEREQARRELDGQLA